MINFNYTGVMVEISGLVERVTYYNQENGYTVLRLRPEITPGDKIPGVGLDGLLTVVGNLPELSAGEQIKLEGEYTTHAKHGLQFKATICEQLLPVTVSGIERYLGSGLIKGIGPELAKRIVRHFRENTLQIIEEDPEQLKNVPGIGKDRTGKIIQAWQEMNQIKDIMLFLHSHNISTNLAVKIYKNYGDQSLEIVRNNPYRLEQDIYGIGFKTADRIAQNLGLPKDHPSRIEAGIVYSINESVNDGHVYIPEKLLIDRAVELLELEPMIVGFGLERLQKQRRINIDVPKIKSEISEDDRLRLGEASLAYGDPVVYLSALYHSECGVAKFINHLLNSPVKPKQGILLDYIGELSEEQYNALNQAINNPVSIITGGPGTGKTTCLRALIDILEDNHLRYALISPTGRAAKRLSEATGHAASTIHRLLAYHPTEGFKYNGKNPLKLDFLVVDEASMLDLILAYHLLSALEPGTQVLFVGDIDQLPSVGAGDVLNHIILSNRVPVSRLTKIFRQAQGSEIITNAHRINQGKYPQFSSSSLGDFFLFPAEDAHKASEWVIDVVCHRIPENFHLDSINDIQVLTPMYRGAAGVDALNELLQSKLNPQDPRKLEQKLNGGIFRIGDKIMQTKNNYDKDVFNGDIGIIKDIDKINQNLTVIMDDSRKVLYDFNEVDEIVLAYAVTVHKSQGSEFPAIVMPIITQHYVMLQRNLLYTAVTRAQKLCVLIGNPKAIHISIANNQYAQRFSKLSERLKEFHS